MELHFFEKLIVTALRKFTKLLYNHNYSITGISYGDRDGDFIKYKSNDKGLEIHIVFTWVKNGISLDIIFYKKSILLLNKSFNLNGTTDIFPDIKHIKKEISEENYISVIESYHECIEKYFLSIIEGKKWIDEIKKK